MANISEANGTITLEGSWTEEALDALLPVLDSWSFYGEYGIQYYGVLSLNDSTDFDGVGRWSFGSTLDSIDAWTRDWINHAPADTDHPLTAEEYDRLLQLMHEQELIILFEFNDAEEGVQFEMHETGVMISDGKTLTYKVLSNEVAQYSWEELGSSCFRAAVDFFSGFVTNADPIALVKWVKCHVKATRMFEWGGYDYDHLYDEDEMDGVPEAFDEKALRDFIRCFSPDTEAWYRFLNNYEKREGHSLPKGHAIQAGQHRPQNYERREEHPLSKDMDEAFRLAAASWKNVKQVAFCDMLSFPPVMLLHKDGTVSIPSLSDVAAFDTGLFAHLSLLKIDSLFSDVTAIAAGVGGFCVLKANGTVDGFFTTMDLMGNSRKLNEFKEWQDITAIAIGQFHIVGLKKDGTVVADGIDFAGQCQVDGWTDITAIAANDISTFGLKRDGTVVSTQGTLPGTYEVNVSQWRNIKTIAVSHALVCGMDDGGRLFVTGRTDRSGMEDIDAKSYAPATALMAGENYFLGLKADGTVESGGANDDGQCDVSGWKDIVSVASQGTLSVGVKANGTVVTAGKFMMDGEGAANGSINNSDLEKGDLEDDLINVTYDDVSGGLSLSGSRFVLTGVFFHLENDRDKIKVLIEKKGGYCTQVVSGKTDFVVIGSRGGYGWKKLEAVEVQRAKGKEIKVIREEDLFDALEGKTVANPPTKQALKNTVAEKTPAPYPGRRVPLPDGMSVLLPNGGKCSKGVDGSYSFTIPIIRKNKKKGVWKIRQFTSLGALLDLEDDFSIAEGEDFGRILAGYLNTTIGNIISKSVAGEQAAVQFHQVDGDTYQLNISVSPDLAGGTVKTFPLTDKTAVALVEKNNSFGNNTIFLTHIFIMALNGRTLFLYRGVIMLSHAGNDLFYAKYLIPFLKTLAFTSPEEQEKPQKDQEK